MYEIKKEDGWKFCNINKDLFFSVQTCRNALGLNDNPTYYTIIKSFEDIISFHDFEEEEFISQTDFMMICTHPDVNERSRIPVLKKIKKLIKQEVEKVQDEYDLVVRQAEEHLKLSKNVRDNNKKVKLLEDQMKKGFEELKKKRKRDDDTFKIFYDGRAWVCKTSQINWSDFDEEIKNNVGIYKNISSYQNMSEFQCEKAIEYLYFKYGYLPGDYQKLKQKKLEEFGK